MFTCLLNNVSILRNIYFLRVFWFVALSLSLKIPSKLSDSDKATTKYITHLLMYFLGS